MIEAKPIEKIRHSLSHLLAMAVLKNDPEAKLGGGPVIENGFYYDFDLSPGYSPTPESLKQLEKTMRELIRQDIGFAFRSVTTGEAKKIFADQPYKLELIKELAQQGEPLSVYQSGDFVDLCAGPHVASAASINPNAFKLERLAGAYWRGDEKNKMLTRIYGVALETAAELKRHLRLKEAAEKRDHKKLGRELDLFLFSELVGAGLPLWTPRGTLIRNLLDDFVWQLRRQRGYEQVDIPHLAKKVLYETSGHWEKFQNELLKVQSREGRLFALKPMNCPHHIQIYQRRQWSWRELPQRYATTTKVYRDEQSGELSGLVRTRAFTQDDAHVFCRRNQIKEEVMKIWEIVQEFYGAFGFNLKIRVSLHDPKNLGQYLGTPEDWRAAEETLAEIVRQQGAAAETAIGEAAFYGPKIDFLSRDSLEREWQLATIQLDMNLPERFNLSCVNEQGEQERIVMIHAAIMGSLERFIAILIEHYAGVFPLWLSPVQAVVLPVSEKFWAYAREVKKELAANGVRAELDEKNESVGKKVRAWELQKVPYLAVIGEKEVSAKTVTVRKHGKKDVRTEKLAAFIERLRQEITSRK